MIPLPTAISTGFTWKRLPRNGGFEFRRDNKVVGSLKRPSIWSGNLIAESSHGTWMFRRCGFLGTSVEVVGIESQQQVATFKSSWGMQGVLTFADGQRFRLSCKGVFHPVWTITADSCEPVLRLHSREKSVEMRDHSQLSEERLLLLAMFALDRVLQAEEDAASAAVVAVFS